MVVDRDVAPFWTLMPLRCCLPLTFLVLAVSKDSIGLNIGTFVVVDRDAGSSSDLGVAFPCHSMSLFMTRSVSVAAGVFYSDILWFTY
jgi:hypothetical protein